MSLTFVSAFLNLFEDRSALRSPDTHINHFKRLAELNINIILFLSNSYRDDFERICGHRDNVRVEYVELYDFESYIDLEGLDIRLPSQRNTVKDTRNFLVLMNTKLECIHRAMELVTSSHYAWIDFGIKHVLTETGLEMIKTLSKHTYPKALYMPGCWSIGNIFFHMIHWRFCGGFFLGDKDTLGNFYKAAKDNWKETVETHGLVWEVNYWAYLETKGFIRPTWYQGDHNDSILHVPL